ncbi:hypothetical protein TNCV_3624611, partial [Trichonephila clavipes]
DGVQKPRHVSLDVKNIIKYSFKASLNRGNRKKTRGLRSGEGMMIVGSMGVTNEQRTWGRKPRLVDGNCGYSLRSGKGCTRRDEWLNECVDLERRGRIDETCPNTNFPRLGRIKSVRHPLQSVRKYMRCIFAYFSLV